MQKKTLAKLILRSCVRLGQILAVAMAGGEVYYGMRFAGVIILLLAASEWKWITVGVFCTFLTLILDACNAALF